MNQPPVVGCSVAVVKPAGCGADNGSATVTPSGGTPPYTYLWDNGETSATAIGLSKGLHSVTVSDNNKCTKACEITIPYNPCDEFCTYTQGKYGNQDKSMACILEPDKIPTKDMVIAMLKQGDLKIGAGSNYILFKDGDAGLINTIMPGGSGCGILSGICIPSTSLSCLSPYLTKQGRLNSGLISQTLALGLNLRINDGLDGLPLESGKWLTTQKKLDCPKGSGVVDMVCTPVYGDPMNPTTITGYTMTVDPYWYYKLPEGVLCYMTSKGYALTVQGLYNLANDALGQARTFPAEVTCGDITYTVKYCDIVSAVDVINNAFDECRVFVGYLDAKFTCPLKAASIVTAYSSLRVYPNPFNDKVTFEFSSHADVHAVLEVMNILGQKVSILMDQKVRGGTLNRIDYQPADKVPGIYIYRLKLNDSVQTGRIIYNRH